MKFCSKSNSRFDKWECDLLQSDHKDRSSIQGIGKTASDDKPDMYSNYPIYVEYTSYWSCVKDKNMYVELQDKC